MSEEANTLQRAAAQLWLFADEETVALANSVVLAATDVVSAHQDITVSRMHNYLRVALLGRYARDVEQVSVARSQLAAARRALIVHSRNA